MDSNTSGRPTIDYVMLALIGLGALYILRSVFQGVATEDKNHRQAREDEERRRSRRVRPRTMRGVRGCANGEAG